MNQEARVWKSINKCKKLRYFQVFKNSRIIFTVRSGTLPPKRKQRLKTKQKTKSIIIYFHRENKVVVICVLSKPVEEIYDGMRHKVNKGRTNAGWCAHSVGRIKNESRIRRPITLTKRYPNIKRICIKRLIILHDYRALFRMGA